MSDPHAEMMGMAESHAADLLKQENGLVRQIVAAYNAARRDLLATLADAYATLGDNPTPEQIRTLTTNVGLIQAIDQRLASLEGQTEGVLRQGLTAVGGDAFDSIAAEVGILARALGVEMPAFAIDPLLEVSIAPTIDQVPGLIASLKSQLTASLRESLAAGERMTNIAKGLLGVDDSVFRRGLTSAELATRRAVVQAENNARLRFLENASKSIKGLQKQAVAFATGSDTTETCLRVHGQIQPINKPFDIVGRPSFGEKQMQPPFHWNCRTTVAAYHPIFEETSAVTTDGMVAQAKAELARR